MKKQHYTTNVSRLVHPPLLSEMKHLHLNCQDSIYASNKIPLGRGKSPNIPNEAKDRCFGKLSEYGDRAHSLMYPSDCRLLTSLHDYDFLPPKSYSWGDKTAAGVSNSYIPDNSNSSEQMKIILNEESSRNNIKRDKETEYKICFKTYPVAKSTEQKSFWKSLKNLLYMDDELYKKFYYFAVDQLKNCQTITVNDFQEVVLNFGFCVPVFKLESLLSEFDLSVDGEVDAQKLCVALCQKPLSSDSLEEKKLKYLQSRCRVFGDDQSFSNCFGASEDSNQGIQKTAGVPSGVHTPCIINPTVFERSGIFDEDLSKPRCKNEIISILSKSGMCFKNEMLDLLWEKLSKGGKASIGDIWKAMKHLYLIH